MSSAVSDSYNYMQSVIARYSQDFIRHRPGSELANGHTIALSGATGNVGSLMLDLLLNTKGVDKIYILHRDGNENASKAKIAKLFREKGLDPTVLDRTTISIVYLKIDFSEKDLGLDTKAYDDLRDNLTLIIHSAWLLRFNVGLDAYVDTHVAGVRHLIDLALSSRKKRSPRFFFLSSIAGAVEYKGPTSEPSIGERCGQYLVPECPVDDPTMAIKDQGYGQSKFVSERIIYNAVKGGTGLRATVSRVGQLTGMSTNGEWSKYEYGVILLRAILFLGVCPTDVPPQRFTPSDIGASALVKQALVDGGDELVYFSIECPFPTHWPVIQAALIAMSPKPFHFVPYAQLFEMLQNIDLDPKLAPMMSLLSFYKGRWDAYSQSAALGWNRSVELTPELAKGPLTVEMIIRYIQYQIGTRNQERIDLMPARL